MEVHFEPWVGNKYSDPGILGKKVLVLGHTYPCNEYLTKDGCTEIPNEENSYCRGCGFTQRFCNSVTVEVIKEYMTNSWQGKEGGHAKATHTRFLNTILPEVSNEEAYDYFAFYNFVQIAVNNQTARLGQAPDKYYELSVPPFLETLVKLQPDCVIVWGRPAYERLRYLLYIKGYTIGDIESGDRFCILYHEKKFPVMRIDHPSYRKFNKELWKTRIKDFLQSL